MCSSGSFLRPLRLWEWKDIFKDLCVAITSLQKHVFRSLFMEVMLCFLLVIGCLDDTFPHLQYNCSQPIIDIPDRLGMQIHPENGLEATNE